MKKLLLIVMCLAATAAVAEKARFYQKGTLAEMNAVECGTDSKSGEGWTAVVLGTGSEHVKTRDALCQEYVLKTDRVVYRIRPKEEKHPVLLPVGETAQFRMKKDKMVLMVPELDGKEREYIVVSMKPVAEKSARAEQDDSK